MTDIIKFDKVSKIFEGKKVIDSLDLTIEKGEFFVIVGPSGSGKTSTLKMINALVAPDEGDVYFENKRIIDYDLKKLRLKVGYVLQQIALFPNLNIQQNIELIPEILGWSKDKRQARSLELLEKVKLDATYLKRLPSELSGGEQQRVGILRAIAADPDVIIMDEPFSALDPISRNNLQELVLDIHENLGTTIVFVTHDMKEAQRLGDRIAVMQEGKLLQCASPDEIREHPANDFVKSFFE
ncbi:hypothetical protein Hs20B_07790 [Lactococcus insecticola]|uniref:ABC-type quaternary amine transporter n=1 Tax=Pseudolactococcus insecticola TaxID=2709158 RepID=A0A6A0B7B0_9LACT|nr:hypothetical protein Hs20B_07790 [Lactococcus insecticola]